ncbi:hypothetical protein DDQ41_06010 [Streptomyces spongiicola]|uniref:Uncharacterized protein n=1 Tax=Streptomyces spongiicola TaxID=1690221 RepID=A0ABM6V3K3_9ACTN|nr:hypothetical protein DDQ41_06010 [Streptomyces spongiicola]
MVTLRLRHAGAGPGIPAARVRVTFVEFVTFARVRRDPAGSGGVRRGARPDPRPGRQSPARRTTGSTSRPPESGGAHDRGPRGLRPEARGVTGRETRRAAAGLVGGGNGQSR